MWRVHTVRPIPYKRMLCFVMFWVINFVFIKQHSPGANAFVRQRRWRLVSVDHGMALATPSHDHTAAHYSGCNGCLPEGSIRSRDAEGR
jgi:hypothetical protein